MNRSFFDDYCANPEKFVVMKKPRFIEEHKNLIKVLENKNPKQLDAEKKDQREELEKYIKKSKKPNRTKG